MRTDNRLRKYVLSAALVLALLAGAAAWGGTASDSDAVTIMVMNGNDSGPNSLRDALSSANNGDTIIFHPSVTVIALTSGEISFSQTNITIDGGSGVTITNPGLGFRILDSTATTGALTLKGLIVENGYSIIGAGGGVRTYSQITIENCTFRDNTTSNSYNGGAVFGGSNVTMTDCTFTGNSAGWSGGAVFSLGRITMTDCTFTGNSAAKDGGAVFGGNVTMTDCTFTGNSAADEGGGAVHMRGGGRITMTNCGFWDNTSKSGTIDVDGRITADNTTFFANIITGAGGGVVKAEGSITLRHCTFTNNKMTSSSAYNAVGHSVSVQNCLMTKDGLTGNSNGAISGTGNKLGTGTDNYAAWFGTNTFTDNYVLPLRGIADGATVILGLEKDAAGNTRGNAGDPCLYGAVELPAGGGSTEGGASGGGGGSMLLIGIAAAVIAGLAAAVLVLYKKGKLTRNV
ncbi:MAG: right-handed parallel beta-helix repeat-containing protein [Candidatus Methanoplasma sp.]|nr:right-handed parallel beta-helix repeat-containing protein [Candidatus Methanoplasma sp.]